MDLLSPGLRSVHVKREITLERMVDEWIHELGRDLEIAWR